VNFVPFWVDLSSSEVQKVFLDGLVDCGVEDVGFEVADIDYGSFWALKDFLGEFGGCGCVRMVEVLFEEGVEYDVGDLGDTLGKMGVEFKVGVVEDFEDD